MAQFVKVGDKADFEAVEGGKLVEAAGQRIALFKLADGYYAIEDTCPHAGGPLSKVRSRGTSSPAPGTARAST